MSFGFIAFCGKLPWEAFGYLLKYFFLLNGGFNSDLCRNCLKLEVNPNLKDLLFFEEPIPAIYNYLKDGPSRAVSIFFPLGNSRWLDYFYIFF